MAENPTWLNVVAGALTRSDGRVLMHRRPPDKHHGGLWEFPGGKVEEGESPAQALARELAEELGIAVRPADLSPAGFAQSGPGEADPAIVILLYTLDLWEGEPRALETGAAIGWFTLAEIPDLPKPPLDRALCRDFLHLRAV